MNAKSDKFDSRVKNDLIGSTIGHLSVVANLRHNSCGQQSGKNLLGSFYYLKEFPSFLLSPTKLRILPPIMKKSELKIGQRVQHIHQDSTYGKRFAVSDGLEWNVHASLGMLEGIEYFLQGKEQVQFEKWCNGSDPIFVDVVPATCEGPLKKCNFFFKYRDLISTNFF